MASWDSIRGPVRLSRHDRNQLEIKIEYLLPSIDTDLAEWQVDFWFVLPLAAGVGSGDYPPDLFYEDLRAYVRLKTPHVPLDQLCRGDGAGSPLSALNAVLFRADPTGVRRSDLDTVASEAKLLCSILKSELRDWSNSLGPDEAERIGAGRDLAGYLQSLIADWRDVSEKLLDLPLQEVARDALKFCDESLSLQAEGAALALWEQIAEGPGARKVRKQLKAIAAKEMNHRRAQGWLTVLDDESDDARYLDQARLLKKYVASVLHLKIETSRWHGIARHGALGVAAGIAMGWAVFAQILMLLALDLQIQRGVSLGVLTAFSVGAVFAYILKDRIKATLGAVLSRHLPRVLSDRRHALRVIGADRPVGSMEEWMGFVGRKDLPVEIAALQEGSLRNRVLMSTPQEVLHYRRRMSLKPRTAARHFPRVDGITEVLRLQMGRWVRTLASTRKDVTFLDGGQPSHRKLPNHYYADVLVRFERLTPEPQVRVGQMRLVLDRRGLVAVEEPPAPRNLLVPASAVQTPDTAS
jgi:hypothetical protein